MKGIWRCELCKKEYDGPPVGHDPVQRHTCNPADPNVTGYALMVGTRLEKGDDLYVELAPEPETGPEYLFLMRTCKNCHQVYKNHRDEVCPNNFGKFEEL